MNPENEYALSFYHELCNINRKTNVSIVKHLPTGRLYVKKELLIFDCNVYSFICQTAPSGVPRIKELIEGKSGIETENLTFTWCESGFLV